MKELKTFILGLWCIKGTNTLDSYDSFNEKSRTNEVCSEVSETLLSIAVDVKTANMCSDG